MGVFLLFTVSVGSIYIIWGMLRREYTCSSMGVSICLLFVLFLQNRLPFYLSVKVEVGVYVF